MVFFVVVALGGGYGAVAVALLDRAVAVVVNSGGGYGAVAVGCRVVCGGAVLCDHRNYKSVLSIPHSTPSGSAP